MGGQYKKRLRAEKAKVKLKGAKLPKGLNVTKTDFKVRKINIREQLKQTQYNVAGERQFNIKECLTRLKHHSSNYRLEALRNLREAIISGNNTLSAHMHDIVQQLSAICLDEDKDTRRESFKTLGSLLSNMQVQQIAPFFHMISSYLRCAMTHIQTHIKEDSLLMLDVLLQHVPQLLTAQNQKIMQNFLEMISRVRAEGDKANRMLTINLGSKQTSIKWRNKVLERLQQMLKALVQQKHCSMQSDNKTRVITYSSKETQYYAVKRFSALNNSQLSLLGGLFNSTVADGSELQDTALARSNMLRTQIEHLMPLLMESWLEVRPQQTDARLQLISADAALTLKVVLEIMQKLWLLVDLQCEELNNNELSEWFQQKYGTSFVQNFLQQNFPYEQQELAGKETLTKRAKKSASKTSETGCLQQNINLTYLLQRFQSRQLQKCVPQVIKLLQYLQQLITQLSEQTVEDYAQLPMALRCYLLQHGTRLLQLPTEQSTRQLLQATIQAYLQAKFSSKEGIAGRVLLLLCDIVQQAELRCAYGEAEFEPFLQFLPQLLLKPNISEHTLLAMCNLGKQQNLTFLQTLQQHISAIIQNLSKIQVQAAVNAFEGKKHIMNMFYWCERNSWTPAERAKLLQQLENCISDKRILSYFTFVLTN